MMDSFFTFEGEPSTEFSVFIEDDHTNDSAEREYETASVPGMNGDILYSNGRLKNGTARFALTVLQGKKSISKVTEFAIATRR